MNPTATIPDPTHFDVRDIPCKVKHAQIFQRWIELPVGAHFVLINDHDPVPLYYQFAAQFPGAFTWEYLLRGPDECRVKISRISESPKVATTSPISNATCATGNKTGDIDARGLEPPEPLMRILKAVESLGPGASLRVMTDRRPLHLFPELDARGISYTAVDNSDGSCLTTLHRA